MNEYMELAVVTVIYWIGSAGNLASTIAGFVAGA